MSGSVFNITIPDDIVDDVADFLGYDQSTSIHETASQFMVAAIQDYLFLAYQKTAVADAEQDARTSATNTANTRLSDITVAANE